jgi:hypothetical protein
MTNNQGLGRIKKPKAGYYKIVSRGLAVLLQKHDGLSIWGALAFLAKR